MWLCVWVELVGVGEWLCVRVRVVAVMGVGMWLCVFVEVVGSVHGGGGQVCVLVLQPSVKRQPPLLRVFRQQRGDAEGLLQGPVGLHCLTAHV